jgi:hypothetical protein
MLGAHLQLLVCNVRVFCPLTMPAVFLHQVFEELRSLMFGMRWQVLMCAVS